MEPPIFLHCPLCHGGLYKLDERLVCRGCKQDYSYCDGVIDFSAKNAALDLNSDPKLLEGQPSWRELLEHQCMEAGSEQGLQATIDALAGEFSSTFKIILPDLSGASILYIGMVGSEIPQNIARHSGLLTVMTSSNWELNLVEIKNRLRDAQPNICYIAGERQDVLPFSDQCFDGIIYDQIALDGLSEKGCPKPSNKIVMTELARTLKPAGWIFVRAENRYNRDKISSMLSVLSLLRASANTTSMRAGKNIFDALNIKNQMSLFGCQSRLRMNGFSHQRISGFESNHSVVLDLRHPLQVERFVSSKKGFSRYIPAWLYRLTTPAFGVFSQKEQLAPSVLEGVIACVASDIERPIEHCNILSVEANQKCKCIITLRIGSQKRMDYALVVKIAIDELAQKHLRHGYQGLVHLEAIPNGEFFPKPVSRGAYLQTQYYVEQAISGESWITQPHDGGEMDKVIINDILGVISSTQAISPHDESASNQDDFNARVRCLKKYAEIRSPQALDAFTFLVEEVVQTEADQTTPHYFYKSDFSVSNILLKGNQVSGIIDLDFWGFSQNKLADYADFVESFSRNFLSMSQTDVLVNIHDENLSVFRPALAIEEHLKLLDSGLEELKRASIITWVNRVHHAFEFKRVTLHEGQINRLFFDPLEALFAYKQKGRVIT
ncbi:MAG: hypothetical protein KUG83_08225 [Gammaproteobacteria bacterium]|nr:hypothetical protein [Gammaproteobacteria bacterium]